ncbi:MAG: lipoprotein intramolecular transacylase Lit [Chloroflexota bacterium]
MGKLSRFIAGAVFVVALPVFLVVGNLIWVTLDVGTYERLFFGYGAAARTGLSANELHAVAAALAAHFRDGTPITLTIVKAGQVVPLFVEREIVHLRDVYNLVHFGLNALAAIFGYFVLFALAGMAWWRGRYWRSLAGYVLRGALLTLGVLVVVAFGVLFAFDQLFWMFHVVSFPNDFWILDPRQSYLLNLFAQNFFEDTTLGVAIATAVEAVTLALVSGVVIWWRANHGPAAREKRAGTSH